MVLYYDIVKSKNDTQNNVEYNSDTVSTVSTPYEPTINTNAISTINTPSTTINTPNNILSNLIGNREFYYTLLEDNFNNLSIDDKLVIMHRTSILRSSITNNYLLMCLAFLIIITIKLYSK